MIHKLFAQKPTIDWIGWRWLPISLMVIAALYVLVAVLLRMP